MGQGIGDKNTVSPETALHCLAPRPTKDHTPGAQGTYHYLPWWQGCGGGKTRFPSPLPQLALVDGPSLPRPGSVPTARLMMLNRSFKKPNRGQGQEGGPPPGRLLDPRTLPATSTFLTHNKSPSC